MQSFRCISTSKDPGSAGQKAVQPGKRSGAVFAKLCEPLRLALRVWRTGVYLEKPLVAACVRPAAASCILQRDPSCAYFCCTQTLTFSSVGFSPTQRRRTSASHAARSDGVTSGGSTNSSSEHAGVVPASVTRNTQRRTFIGPRFVLIVCPQGPIGPPHTNRRNYHRHSGTRNRTRRRGAPRRCQGRSDIGAIDLRVPKI